MLWMPVECSLCSVLMNVLENIHVAYIYSYNIYIHLSYMIVNLACIISNHHCVRFVIPIEFIRSIITMYHM